MLSPFSAVYADPQFRAQPTTKFWRWLVSSCWLALLCVSLCCVWSPSSAMAAPASTDTRLQPVAHATSSSQRQRTSRQARQSAAAEATDFLDPLEDDTIGTVPPDIQRILNRGKLIVAVLGTDNPPFFMDMGNQQLGGLDIQLAKAIAEQLGVNLEINRSAKTFNAVVDTVYAGAADIGISKISRTMKRAVRVRFSRPYLQMRQGLLINRLQLAQQAKGGNVTETVRQLTGKVGVIKGSSYVGFLKQKFPKASIVELDSWGEIVDAVSAGEILAGYRDELEIKKVVLTKPDAALQLQTAVLTDTRDALAMVLPWSSTHLLAFADQYLDTLDTEYTVAGLFEAYSEYLAPQSENP